MYYQVKLRIRDFQWDEHNVVHLELGHGITAEEAEEVFAVKPLFRKTRKGHFVVLGPTIHGRYLSIVFELLDHAIARVITGWDMDSAEKRYWRKRKRK